ncbi:uncharacterized protein zgc:112980 [Brachionichthys hirsutus]|uniref:uncharacterized protein zgc:112980 n=1 Tax=Brachionichthys hirsutus TaxID=412623 RepID=UPI0036049945
MESAVDNGAIIILSDDDDDDDDDDDCVLETSVEILERRDLKRIGNNIHPTHRISPLIDKHQLLCLLVSDCTPSPLPLDEDLVVTFSRRAEVLPHARYDCPIHPFTPADCETGAPLADNHLICHQCFCYICDKLASTVHSCLMCSQCVSWCHSGVCHCNSHKKSDFWSHLRNRALLGGLKSFNLTLPEIDAHLRQAETMLKRFRQELAVLFSSFLKGKLVNVLGLNADPGSYSDSDQQILIHDYTPVYEFVSTFLDMADKQDDRAAAVMRLGAAEDFIQHYTGSRAMLIQSPMANTSEAKVLLLQRVISSVRRQMVMSDFTPEFTHKLQEFYKRLCLPAELKNLKSRCVCVCVSVSPLHYKGFIPALRSSLCVRRWDDVLLVSVLKGQNVLGVRKDKGKKDVLMEDISVVLLRAEALQRQQRYRELCRYLQVVQSDNVVLLQQVKDLTPFFVCLEGDFPRTLLGLFPTVSAPASRFTPRVFLLYLSVFKTATAPKLMVSQLAQLCDPEVAWEPIRGAAPLKHNELVRFALRVHSCCSDVFTDCQCWITLLALVGRPLPAPSPAFLHEAKAVVNSILPIRHWTNVHIPRSFQEAYPEQALLLLVTGALGWRIIHSALRPALPVLNAMKENFWALKWLVGTFLSHSAECLTSFLQEAKQEAQNDADGGTLLFLHALESNLSPPPAEKDDQCDNDQHLQWTQFIAAAAAPV